MKSLITILLLSAFSCLFVRCSIEKRLYNRGFHVEWNKKIHFEKEVVKKETKKDIEQTQFAASTFTQTDSVTETHQSIFLSKDSSQLASNIHRVIGNERKKDTYSSSDTQSGTKLTKKEETNETKEPVNKKALIFALVFAAVIIALIVLLAILAPAISAEMITLGIIVISFGTAIFFQVFNRKTKSEEDSKENTKPIEEKPISSDNSPKLADPERKLAVKKNSALVATFIGVLGIGLAIIGILSIAGSGLATDAAVIFIGSLFSGLIGIIVLLVAAILWSNYHDAKKESEPIETEPDKPPKPKVKGRGWILLGILGLGVFAVVIDYFRTN